ncbi:uncharacterized protein K441DRAFT_318019 [Cenococcum geophilum 1.58]|uniref:uncharacterized protein n=1 Tax=Cenococcum geophilum 1.58 TaxID=794803 RepID=UPI00358E11C6|nr:hypothetical protein K441DRAFT_318019 [Cenococcum geophilum 1.58]
MLLRLHLLSSTFGPRCRVYANSYRLCYQASRRGAGGAAEARLHMGNPTDPTRPRSTEASPVSWKLCKDAVYFLLLQSRSALRSPIYNYYTAYKTRDHVEPHLDVYKPGDTICCPDSDCQKPGTGLHSRLHFMNYAAYKHNYDIFRRRDR